MDFDKRRKELDDIFRDVDGDEKRLIDNLLDEVVFLEGRMTELKKYPFISVHPTKPALQKITPAAKLYKECTQSYMNAIRILCNVLRKVESTAQDDLMRRLGEFMND
jgi:hypothetical protein